MRSSMSVTPPVSVVDEDAARLAELGYKQELHRGMSGFSNVAVIGAVLAFSPDHHQTLSWTFFHYENHNGWASPIYVFLIGSLMAQYTYTCLLYTSPSPRDG